MSRDLVRKVPRFLYGFFRERKPYLPAFLKKELIGDTDCLHFVNCASYRKKMKITEESDIIKALGENIRQPLLLLDQKLHIIWANSAFRDVFGLSSKEITGIRIFSLANNGWDIPGLHNLLEEILPEKKKVVNYEIKHHFSESGDRLMMVNAEKLIFESGAEDVIVLSIEDTTGAREADKANAMLAAIIESSEDAIVSKSLKGIVTSWNKSAEKLLGYTSAEMIGQPILKIIPDDRIDEEPEIIRKITEGETIAHFETERRAKSGKLVDISLTISPIKDNNGRIIGASKIARDITDQIESRKKINESEKRFQNLIYSSPSAIGILEGEDFRITIANKPIVEFFGKGEDVIGKKIFEVLPELEEQGYRRIFTSVYTSGVAYNSIETPLQIIKNGKAELRYYNLILYPQYDMNDQIGGIGIIASDVTSQALINKNTKEREERFRSLTQTLPQLIWVTDADGNAEFTSSRWAEYSGIEPAGKTPWVDIVHQDDLQNITDLWDHIRDISNEYESEVRLKSKEGEYKWHSMVAKPVLNGEGKIVKWVGAFTDIHNQKEKEEKKDEFMGIASHEMKTPLTTAKAYLQMLELSLDETQTDAKLFAYKASQSVDRLNELISELLDVSKIQFGKLNYTMTTFNFNEMIESTVETMRLTSRSSTLVSTGKVKDEVKGDRDRLQQVVINLLSNAIKYSPKSDEVFISISQNGDQITVAVKDNGIGISQPNLNKIFEKYHRVEEHAVQFQGMGVGLFISHEIIQRHNGKLWVESEVGKGSTFYFTLPVDGSITP